MARRPSEQELAPATPPLELQLERGVNAPSLARAAVSQLAAGMGLDASTQQTLVLLVSELVTNAVVHSTGPHEAPIGLTVHAEPGAVRVSVTDAGVGFTPRQRDPDSIEDGYGLFLLEKASSRWGVDSRERTTVWFELPRESE